MGATVYPAPAFVRSILSNEVIRALVVRNPTATALSPAFPVGEVLIVTVGADVYPLPSLFIKI